MKCDVCDNEATVHNLVIKGGKPAEQHLCERCATKTGLNNSIPVAPLMMDLVKQIAAGQAITPSAPTEKPPAVRGAGTPAVAQCPGCGLPFASFRQHGLLGCAICYTAFADQLGPLLDRAHDGATHHTGKMPRRILPGGADAGTLAPDAPGGAPSPPKPTIDLQDILHREAQLRKQLQSAIAAEQFERAACLRDELIKLGQLAELAGFIIGGKKAPPAPEAT